MDGNVNTSPLELKTEAMLEVVVLCGGKSAEHDISLLSTAAVIGNLDTSKFTVSVIGIGRDGGTLPSGELRSLLKLAGSESIALPQTSDWVSYLRQLNPDRAVVFPVLHGPHGEDGTVQGLLELFGLPFVGPGVGGSAVGMNKIYCKSILRAAGLPVLPWVSLNREEWSKNSGKIVEVMESDLGYPVFVKPANMGSSVGINRSDDRLQIVEHVKTALEYDDYVLVEKGIAAREIEVAVLGSFEPQASVPGEIVPGDVFYSYEAKYLTEDSKLLIPAPLNSEQQSLLRDLAIEAFKVLQLDGLARVDFLLDKDSGEAWINEPNTIPGFTRISMYPKLWEESGVPYSRLLERLIELGRQRHLRRSRFSVDR